MPSSSMNLLNISSMDDLTAFASERSSRGSRLLMIRLCRRERTSRCASRAGAVDCESGPSAGDFGGCWGEPRSEERRVGKEGRTGWGPQDTKKNMEHESAEAR